MTIPTYLPYYVLAGTAGIVVTILFGLRYSARIPEPPRSRKWQRFHILAVRCVSPTARAVRAVILRPRS
jgi:hypothetical protein